MTVEELIGELMASCQSLDDEVLIFDVGSVTKVSCHNAACAVCLNDYASDEDKQ